jgi:arylsulfatase A-like enzyme
MHRRLAEWFSDGYQPDKPFFLFLNYIDAHTPYHLPSHLRRWASAEALARWNWRLDPLQFAHMITGADLLSSTEISEIEAVYDDEINYLDSKIGQLLDFLRATGLEDNTAVMITSDHGEHFGEHHMLNHAYSLYEPLVRVPLVAHYRDCFPAGRDSRMVQTHDAYPTILELAGVEWHRQPGQNCESLLQPVDSKPRYGISESLVPCVARLHEVCKRYKKVDASRFLRRLRAIQHDNMKLIRPSEGKAELYDLANDPLEIRDLADEIPETTRKLAAKLDEWAGSFEHYRPSPVSDGLLEEQAPGATKALRGLGYL